MKVPEPGQSGVGFVGPPAEGGGSDPLPANDHIRLLDWMSVRSEVLQSMFELDRRKSMQGLNRTNLVIYYGIDAELRCVFKANELTKWKSPHAFQLLMQSDHFHFV